MTNRNKDKGSAAERAVVTYLRERGWTAAERRLAGAALDRGDIAGIPNTVIEVKDCGKTELAAWIAEAERERANDGANLGVVWHKRRGKGSAAEWYVTMTGAQFADLLAAHLPTPAATGAHR